MTSVLAAIDVFLSTHHRHGPCAADVSEPDRTLTYTISLRCICGAEELWRVGVAEAEADLSKLLAAPEN